jgi:hypothetical protein
MYININIFSFTDNMTFLKQIGNLKMSAKLIYMASRNKTIRFYATYNTFYKLSNLKLAFSCQYLHKKYRYYSFKSDDTDSDAEDNEYKRDIKNIILPRTNDLLTIKISESKSLHDIFELIQHNKSQLNWENISMAIAMIRELQIIYYRVCMHEKNLNCSNIIFENKFENILTNNDFLNLLNLLEKHHLFMDIQCLSYSILCLYKIGVNLNCKVNQTLSLKLKELLMTTPIEEIPTCILSRFTVSTVSQRDLSGLYILKDVWPIILKKLSKHKN